MKKTYEELEQELRREIEYSTTLNRKIDRFKNEFKNRITIEQHEKEMTLLKAYYERELTEIKNGQAKLKAGRKKIVTKEIAEKVLKLREQGLSFARIADEITAEQGIKIGRTTVSEIIYGKYKI